MEIDKKQKIEDLISRTKILDDNYFNSLAKILEIEEIDKDVKEYIKTHYETELIDGPFILQGARESLRNMYTFKEIYKFWEGEESENKILPILHLGNNGQDEQVFVIAESGQIISAHIDSFIEESYVYGHNSEYNAKQFLLDLSKDYCIVKLSNLLNLQNLLIDCPDFNSVTEKYSYKEIQKITANCFNWSLKELDKRTSHPGMNFAYFLLEEN